jgi:hypothetical protein
VGINIAANKMAVAATEPIMHVVRIAFLLILASFKVSIFTIYTIVYNVIQEYSQKRGPTSQATVFNTGISSSTSIYAAVQSGMSSSSASRP